MNLKHMQLHITALQSLVIGVLAVLMRRDPDLVREVVNDRTFTDVASVDAVAGYSREDLQTLQQIMDIILGPMRTALGDVPPPNPDKDA